RHHRALHSFPTRRSSDLHGQGHSVCPHVIADCLRELGYSLQANRKTREGSSHMDRDAQFHYINDQAKAFLAANEPVISVDTKKKDRKSTRLNSSHVSISY